MIAEVLQIYSCGGQGYDYWRYLFPAYIIGSAGAMIGEYTLRRSLITVYFGAAVSILVYSPPEMSGVISAWVNVQAQIGGAIALAIQSAFETEDIADWMKGAGRTFWFMFAWVGFLGLQYIVFWKKPGTPAEEHELTRRRIAESGLDKGVVEEKV